MALIDPLLQVLGWDTSDPSLVVPEYVVRGRKADYILVGPEERLVANLEAKKLGEPLHTHLEQMLNYSNMADIEYAGITDGDQWELYEVFSRGTLEERRMLSLQISASSSYQSALNLLLLWRPNLSSGQAQHAKEPITISPPKVGPTPTPPDSKEWVPLSQFSASKGTNCPKSIRFPDGSEHQTKYWYDLVVGTVGWLWSKKILRMDNFSDFPSRGRCLFNTKAIHPNGANFHNPKPVSGTRLIVEANMSGADSLEKARALLSHYGQDVTTVRLKGDPS